MNQVVSFAMLLAFTIQQFSCCCGNVFTHSCEEHGSAALSHNCTSDEHDASEHHRHLADECDHDHSGCTDESDTEGDGGGHSHQHHICFGSHVFYVSSVAPELSPGAQVGFLSVLPPDLAIHAAVARTSLLGDAHRGMNAVASAPQRSTLCVYRI